MRNCTLVATGESFITMKQSVHSEPAFLEMVQLIRDADVAFTNLEVLLHDYEADVYPAAQSGGIHVRADPSMIEELKWMGFDLFSTANNHSLDYMYGGLFKTIQHLKAAGVAYAGIGSDLAEARRPAYLDTPKGRVALIAAASDFAPFARAGAARWDMHGRPGLNPLRFETHYTVDEGTMADLKRLEKTLGLPELIQTEDAFHFLGTRFVLGQKCGEHTTPHPADMQGNLEAIREAARQADWVLFSIHAHQGRAHDPAQPPEYLECFARACIDAGAHAVIGHGYHGLRGIEVWKGRPIFYGLGNFIFQNETVTRMPADFYEQVGLDPYQGMPADAFDARPGSFAVPGKQKFEWFTTVDDYWVSLIAEMRFREGKLETLNLFPIELGQDKPRSQRGRPILAKSELAHKILGSVKLLSKPFGTEISIRDSVGSVHL